MVSGIDSSHFQGTPDWSKVRTQFLIHKCTQGTEYKDPTYQTYKANARKNGILFGSYHFADGTDPVKEAEHFIQTVGDIQPGEFLVLDYEIHLAEPVKWCKEFLRKCNELVGFRPLIYMNVSTCKGFDWSTIAKDNGLWIADPSSTPPRIKWWNAWSIHQYTIAPEPGFSGGVDQDRFNGTLEELKGFGKPSPALPNPSPPPKDETILSQRDPRWAALKMGKSQSTVGRYGCTITSIAAATAYFNQYHNPGFLSKFLRFTPEGLLIWDSLPEQTIFKLEKRFYGQLDTVIKEALAHPRKAVLIQVENYHWVLGLGRSLFGGYRMMDPWFGDNSTTNRYKNITGGAVLITKS